MGAWGTGSFENDDALDWLGDIAGSEDLSALESALDDVDDSSPFLEAPACTTAIAAAEVIALLRGRPGRQLPDEAKEFALHFDKVPSLLVAKARVAVIRIGRKSELRSLWEASDHLEEWEAGIQDLARRLVDHT